MSISKEAIEAAVDSWPGFVAHDAVDLLRESLTASLTAAAPHIQAAALRDAAEVVQEECYVRSGDCFCGSAAWLTARADRLEGGTK